MNNLKSFGMKNNQAYNSKSLPHTTGIGFAIVIDCAFSFYTFSDFVACTTLRM